METPLPNRLAVYITGFIALLAGLAPLIGNLDWESTAGIVAGLLAIAAIVREWLINWGKWERGEGAGLLPGDIEDDFDEEAAEPVPDELVKAAQLPAGATDYETTYEAPAQTQKPPPVN